jgi:uncharacterized protein (TIGR03000 family)
LQEDFNMYGVVLVMALAGSAEAPDCHNRCGCHGGGYGGCYGGYGGCYGGGYGGCYGGRGCYGGGYGGCYGGCYGGGYGCYGGGYGGCYGGGGVYMPVEGGAKGMPKGEKLDAPKQKGPDEVATPATIVVSLPAAAKLTIDGYVSKQTSNERRLVTVPIQPGQEFTYEFVAELNGARQTQNVTVRGGQTAPVNFSFSTVPATASR